MENTFIKLLNGDYFESKVLITSKERMVQSIYIDGKVLLFDVGIQGSNITSITDMDYLEWDIDTFEKGFIDFNCISHKNETLEMIRLF